MNPGYFTAPTLFEVDLETGKARKIAERPDGVVSWRDWQVDAQGRVGASLDYLFDGGRWSIRNAGKTSIAEGIDPMAGVDLVALGPKGDTLVYAMDNDGAQEPRMWMEVPLAGGPAKTMLTDVAARRTYIDPRTHALIGYERDGSAPSYHFFDPVHQKRADALVKAFPGLNAHIVSWNDAFDRLIVTTDGPGDPQSWWMVDLTAHRADPLGTAYHLPDAAVAPMQTVKYKAADGLEIEAVLTLPPGRTARNLPVIVLPHGGFHQRDYPGFDWWAQALASRGYAVVQPNFRGSSGYGSAFERAGHGEWGRRKLSDISDSLGYLAAQGIVDPKRACIMGADYGGYAALAGVTIQTEPYRCAVAVSSVSDITRWINTELGNRNGSKIARFSLITEVAGAGQWEAISPINFVKRASAPILLIHGKDDTAIPHDQSAAMAAALRRAGKPVEFVTLPGEDHRLSKSATRLAMLEAAVAFLEKHNPPDPAP